jgi:hypothetical protein
MVEYNTNVRPIIRYYTKALISRKCENRAAKMALCARSRTALPLNASGISPLAKHWFSHFRLMSQ